MFDDIVNGLERNQVTHNHGCGKETKGMSVLFRNVMSIDFIGHKTRIIKVRVIHNGVSHIRADKGQRKPWVPNSFRQPKALRFLIESFKGMVAKSGSKNPPERISTWPRLAMTAMRCRL